jgi:hypothetical protein
MESKPQDVTGYPGGATEAELKPVLSQKGPVFSHSRQIPDHLLFSLLSLGI